MNNNKNAAAGGRRCVAFGAALLAGLARVELGVGLNSLAGLQVDVGECVKLESPGERLDCYERQVKRAQTAPAAPAAAAPPPPLAPRHRGRRAAAPRAARLRLRVPRQRGTSASRMRVSRAARLPAGPPLSGTITALREIVPNRWLDHARQRPGLAADLRRGRIRCRSANASRFAQRRASQQLSALGRRRERRHSSRAGALTCDSGARCRNSR